MKTATFIKHGVTDQRGAVLPTALILMITLMGLTLAFTSLATTEPVVARNHSLSAQARAFAESGVELAIWAMSNAAPAFNAGIAQAPYDGSQLLDLGASGGFTLRLADGPNPATQKFVTAIGWAPDSSGTLRAARKIEVSLTKPALAMLTPPCALCVKGNLDVSGNASISSWAGTNGVANCATPPTSGTMTTGTTTMNGQAYSVRGPDDATANEPEDMPAGPSNPVPTFSADDLDTLRAVAKANGTYYKGTVSFTSANPLPADGGIVFVDTTTGTDLNPGPPGSAGSPTPSSQMGNVSISGSLTWSGWIIAIGDIDVTGTVNLTGALYARNDFAFNGNGTITGAVIAENKLQTVQSSVDSTQSGNSHIVYNCPLFQSGGGTVATKWTVKPGTFREVAGRTH